MNPNSTRKLSDLVFAKVQLFLQTSKFPANKDSRQGSSDCILIIKYPKPLFFNKTETMYKRFLNNNDYIGIITEEAMKQLIRGNEERIYHAEVLEKARKMTRV